VSTLERSEPDRATRDREAAAMRRAVELSAAGAGATYPNPAVGCVVLDAAGSPVGAGRTADGGRPHAEVVALAAAGERARGGTAVVTLEPCAHTGGTPPCVDALLAAGVARVVVAVRDPHPLAAGGAGLLAAHGVDVEVGLLAAEAGYAQRAWLHGIRTGRPYLTWKFAATLDGRTAAVDGTSRWITGAPARADVHRLRAAADTVLAGVGTVLADDPRLTVRHPDGTPAARQPLRVVVDSRGRTPARARVHDGVAPTLVATAAAFPGEGGRVDLPALLTHLYAEGRRHVFVEGGATLAGALVRAGLVDEVVAYVAPALLGAGPAALEGAGITTIDRALRLELTDVARIGGDVRITAVPLPRTARTEDTAALARSEEA
jgi:diaminohydroxyphosphoribosylaminopyrimidine deaminase/5-amino-6-(5-phosphoribosylamino)uracil reductase